VSRLSLLVRATLVAACLGCLLAGCEPPGGHQDRPVGTYEVDLSTPGPVTPWSDDS
jgi:hypothetical protein